LAAESHRLPVAAAGSAAVALAVVLMAAAWGGDRSYKVPSSAMEPTIHCGRPKPECEERRDARLRVRAYGKGRPIRGDIVVFEPPARAAERCGFSGTFLERVIGLLGATWEEKAGVSYVNGRKLAEPYLAPERRDRNTYPLHRVTGGYFLLGDSRAHSCDSREWGQVPLANIVGKVVKIDQ
jgi:signal peptidase I